MSKNLFGKLREKYNSLFDYLSDSRNFIFVILGLFILSAIIGFFVPAPSQVSSQILSYIQQLLNKTEGYNFIEMFLFIFFNNLKTSFVGLFGGIFFGVIPGIVSLSNGYLLGFVSIYSASESGFGILWRLIPHGIFELFAVFVSLGLGLKLGSFFLEKQKRKFLRVNLRNSIEVFGLIVLPLLVFAALIETLFIFFI
ncbi:hypothetical protein B6U91_00095 [Candidatus Pacearchaeota archaeon ex4484_71]|nr:MAG: hypothetical protein B6U91_00095 [Candidatus Pacearchaeota archaeon ex4484_71]